MSPAEILQQIDSYLARLQQARFLLAQSMIPGKPSRQRRRPTPVKAALPMSPLNPLRKTTTRKSSVPKLMLRPEQLAASRSLGSRSSGSPSPATIRAENVTRLASGPPTETMETRVASEKRPPTNRQPEGVRIRDRTPIKGSAAPPTALSGTVPSGWIGISADEARRSREHKNAVQIERPHVQVPGTPLAGKRAFEALFGKAEQPSEG